MTLIPNSTVRLFLNILFKHKLYKVNLYYFRQESGVGGDSFTFDTAVNICREWKAGRRVNAEEFFFAIIHPAHYINLSATRQWQDMQLAIKNWLSYDRTSDLKPTSKT